MDCLLTHGPARLVSSGLLAAAALASPALGASYGFVGSFERPRGTFDITPDGRYIALVGNEVVLQDAVNGSTHSVIGSVPASTLANFGASFLALNPSGTALAYGDNGFPSSVGDPQQIGVVQFADLDPAAESSPALFSVANSAAAWSDDDTLFVSGANDFFSDTTITRVETSAGTADVVIDQLRGASGAVTIHNGMLITGNGAGNGTGFEATGAIAAFDLAALEAADASVPFNTGTIIADALSAFSLDFDAEGNLIVGGGDFVTPGEIGFISVLDADALDFDGLGTPAGVNDGQQLFDVGGGAFVFPAARYNDATDEIWVFDNDQILRFAIPSPGGVALGGVFVCSLVRRRRG